MAAIPPMRSLRGALNRVQASRSMAHAILVTAFSFHVAFMMLPKLSLYNLYPSVIQALMLLFLYVDCCIILYD